MTLFPSLSCSAHHSSHERGAASVEAVVALPVLVVLFISLFFVRNHLLARQSAGIHARSCAWAYSMNNCNQIPPGCENVLRVGLENDSVSAAVSNELGKVAPGLVKDAIMAVLDPVLDAFLGRALDATTTVTFERPPLYGGDMATAHGTYHLACNLMHQTPIDVVKNVWDSIF